MIRSLQWRIVNVTAPSDAMSSDKQTNFIIRCAKSQEDFDFITKLSIEEKWAIGITDVPHLGPLVEPGFLVGVLDGKRIGCVCATKYGQDDDCAVYYISFFIVDKEYRGRGYGLKMWNVMWESLDKSCNISLDAVVDMVPRYKKMGLCEGWTNKEYILSCSKVVQALSTSGVQEMMESMRIAVKALDEVDFDKLFQYDMSVIGFPRREFLAKWITFPNSLGWAATNEDGNILGYVVMRPSVPLTGKDEQLVSPLYSDDINIARMLLYTSAKAALSGNQKSFEILRMYVPIGHVANPAGATLIENEIGFESAWTGSVRMYTKGVPSQACMEKVLAITP